MDIIDFWEALKRQKWFLIVGTLALVIGIISMQYKVENLSFESRVEPKYTATVQMAVVPVGVTSLSDPAITSNYEGPANFYAQLLQSPQAAAEIAEEQGAVFSEAIGVSVLDNTGILTVTVTATTPDGAERAALGAFRWLEAELAREPVVAALPTEVIEDNPVDVEGGAVASVQLAVDPSYSLDELGVWLAVSTPVDDGFRLLLADAPASIRQYSMILDESQSVEVSIEDQGGSTLDTLDLRLPAVDTTDGVALPIVLDIPRGSVVVGGTGIEIRDDAVAATWDFTGVIAGQQQNTQLSVMRLSDEAIIGVTGLRRVPVMLGGALVGGMLVLLALATTRDKIKQLNLEREQERLTEEDLRRLQEAEVRPGEPVRDPHR